MTRDPKALTICGAIPQQGKFRFKNYHFSLNLLLLAAQEEDGGTHIIHLPTPSHEDRASPKVTTKGAVSPPATIPAACTELIVRARLCSNYLPSPIVCQTITTLG